MSLRKSSVSVIASFFFAGLLATACGGNEFVGTSWTSSNGSGGVSSGVGGATVSPGVGGAEAIGSGGMADIASGGTGDPVGSGGMGGASGGCVPDAKSCDGNSLVQCNAEGTELLAPTPCEDSCVEADGTAECTLNNGSGGAEGSGGSSSADGLISNGDFSQTNLLVKDPPNADNPDGKGFTGWRGGDDAVDHLIADMGCVRWDSLIGWDGETGGVALEEGSYTLSFKVITSGGGDPSLDLKVAGTADPFEPNHYDRNGVDIDADSENSESVTFSVSADDAGRTVGLAFWVGGMSDGAQLCLDDVILTKD